MKNLIAIVTHKQADIPLQEGYKIIAVGKNKIEYKDMLRDNTGINIAEKNPNYCELTAHYWLWKNLNDEYNNIGLVHYRRFFGKKRFFSAPDNILSVTEINKLLSKADIILPKEFYWPCSVEEYYYDHGVGKKQDIKEVEEIIKQYYPEYYENYRNVTKRNHASYCNMFIMKKNMFDSYSEWLFSVLAHVEERVDISSYTAAEARIFGYLSEILINVWVEQHHFKIARVPMMETEYPEKNYTAHVLKRIKINLINTIKFYLS